MEIYFFIKLTATMVFPFTTLNTLFYLRLGEAGWHRKADEFLALLPLDQVTTFLI